MERTHVSHLSDDTTVSPHAAVVLGVLRRLGDRGGLSDDAAVGPHAAVVFGVDGGLGDVKGGSESVHCKDLRVVCGWKGGVVVVDVEDCWVEGRQYREFDTVYISLS